ncbi:MAG: PQQ-binding-like beta-propeller repeat protein [Gemmatimonadales bacterium]
MLALQGSWLRSGAITAAMLIMLAGCGSEDPTGPNPNPDPDPTPDPDPVGSVRVNATTTGDPLALDDGYSVSIGSTSQAIGANASVTLADIPVGSAMVTLGGIDSRCAATPASVTVTVAENATVDADFSVECLANAGEARWMSALGGEVKGTAIAADGTIYAVSVGSTARVVALDPDGTEAWRFDADEYINGAPGIGADGTIYFGTGLGTLYAVNPDGTEKWTYPAGGVFGVARSPAIAADGTLYVAVDNFLDPPSLIALNPDGSLAWTYDTGAGVGAFTGPSVAPDGTIYVGRYDDSSGMFIAVNADGTEKWTYATTGYPQEAAVAGDGTVYFGGQAGFDGSNTVIDGNLYALNADGTEAWTFPTGGIIEGSPALASDGTVYIVSGSDDPNVDPNIGDLWAINSDGTEQWTASLQGCVQEGPTVGADATVYVPVTGCVFGGVGILNAFTPGGASMWTYAVPGTTKTLGGGVTIASDGTAYLASEIEGDLVAVKTESLGLAVSDWPMQGHDNGNTKGAAGGS